MFPSPEGLETSLAGEPVRQVPRLRPRISTPPHVILTGTPVPAGQWSSPIFTDGETEAQRPYIFCKAREGTWRARSKNAGVSAQNKATYPWPPAERRRGGNPGEGRPRFRERDSPDQGPLQFFVVQRPVTRGRPLQWPSTGSPCLSEAGVQGPPPSTSKHTTGKYLPVQPFLCGHTGPRTARPKCLTTQAAGQGWMGPGRPSGQLLSHTHRVTHLWGGGAAEPAQPVWDSRPHWAAGQSPPSGPHGLGKGFTPTLEGGL